MTTSYKFGSYFLTVWAATLACSHSAELLSPPPAENSTSGPVLENQQPAASIWQDGVGEGFRSTEQTFSVEAGVGLGMAAFGSTQAHDLALTSLSYGHMWGPVLGKDHWYRGNFEYRIELFGGAQVPLRPASG